jgi:hypothetical protein
MKCHYTHVKDLGKVLIPECWTVVISQNIEDCNCPKNPHLEHIEQLKLSGKLEEAESYRKIYHEMKYK